MNKTMSRKYLVSITLLTFLLVISWLYKNSQINTYQYQQRVSDLIHIQQLVADVTQQIFLVEGSGSHHFDNVARLETELAKTLQKLNDAEDERLSLEITKLLETVTQIKAAYSIYRNSLLYFPKGTELVRDSIPADSNILKVVDMLEREVLLSVANSSNQPSLIAIQRQIERLKILLQDINPEQRDEILSLLNHGEVLVNKSWTLHQHSQVLLGNKITEMVKFQLENAEQAMNITVARSQHVKIWFYIMIVILTLMLLLIWRKQNQSLVTLRKNTKELSLAASVFKETHDGIVITDSEQNIMDVNPAFTDISGYEKEDVLGKTPKILASGKQGNQFYAEMWESLHKFGFWKGEVWNRDKSGNLYAELLTISAVKNDKGSVINYVGIFSDISDIKQQHEKLSFMAHYDVLTHLPNRTLFTDRFYQAIAHSKRTKTMMAVCFLDLDDFKPVNDTYGHDMGDQLLVEVAERIRHSLREEDTVSRFGGDEFALLLGDLTSVDECYNTLSRIHESVAEPYRIEGFLLNIGVSIGVTMFPDDQGDVDTLLRHADHAMYLAKQEGRNRFHFFNPQQDQEQAHKFAHINNIEKALQNNEFELFYQPKVNMITGIVMGAEALIRWNHPEDGLLSPAQFLPAMTGTDVEIALGEWVIDHALQQIQNWNEAGIRLTISINIASKHLLSKNFIGRLCEKMSVYPSVSSEQLELEILESSALGDLKEVKSIIKTCSTELGIKVALDDFGTGYSSLTHLRNLPVNIIKVDRSFTQKMLDDINDYIIIDSVITLAASFGRTVIAEGVETIEQGLMLILMGCYQAQGYVISRPLPEDEFVAWLNRFELPKEWQELGQKQLSDKDKKELLFELVSDGWQQVYVKKYFNRLMPTWPDGVHKLQ